MSTFRLSAAALPLLVSLAPALAPGVAAAEPPSAHVPAVDTTAPAPPVGELVARALAAAPRIAELEARLAAGRERVEPAGALDDPMLEARLDNIGLDRLTIGDEPMSRIEVGARQSLPYPGKREARRREAAAAADSIAADLEAERRRLTAEVESAYADLFALDAELARLDDAHELLDVATATAAARYGAGDGRQATVLGAQLELTRHDAMRERAAEQRERTAARLRTLADLPAGTPLGRVADLPAAAPPPADLAVRVVAESPAVAQARAGRAAAERRLELERLGLRPDFSFSGGLAYRGDLDPGVSLGVGVELPFWRRHKQLPRIRAAELDVRAADAATRGAELAARGEAEALAAAWQRLERRLRLLDEGLLPQSAAAFDAARADYLAGRGEFAPLLDDLNLWLEARIERARVAADLFSTAAAARALLAPAADGDLP